MRKNVPVLKAVKTKLTQMNSCTIFVNVFSSNLSPSTAHNSEENIQKVINGMALKMRSQNQQGCYFIEAINEYLAISAN